MLSVFGSDSKYWSQVMKRALGFIKDCGFPLQLSFYPTPMSKSIPAVYFSENIKARIGETLNKKIYKKKIYITPTDFFTMQYRQIFKDTQITFRT